MSCCEPLSKNCCGTKRRRKRVDRRVSRQPSQRPEDFLDYRIAGNDSVVQLVKVDEPEKKITEPIPAPQVVTSDFTIGELEDSNVPGTLNHYAHSPDPVSFEEVKKDKVSEVSAHRTSEHTPAVVKSWDGYPAQKLSVERQEEISTQTPTPIRTRTSTPIRTRTQTPIRTRSPTPKKLKNVGPQKISVNVQVPGERRLLSIPTDTTDTVFELRFKIFATTRILPTNQVLLHRGRELPLEKQLWESGISDHSEIQLTDLGKDITEYIIEITDAKTVKKLKFDLKKIENDLADAKKMTNDKLRQNDWDEASRLVNNARVLEVEKAKKEEELKQIHYRHKKGFRELQAKVKMLASEKCRSAVEYAKLKHDLTVAVQKNEVLRVRDISDKLMIQFVGHDGCERELQLLESVVPEMVKAVGGTSNEGFTEQKAESKKSSPARNLYQSEHVETYSPNKLSEVMPRGRTTEAENRLYVQDARYQEPYSYREHMVPGGIQYFTPQRYVQYRQQYPPAAHLISGGAGDPGAYYN